MTPCQASAIRNSVAEREAARAMLDRYRRTRHDRDRHAPASPPSSALQMPASRRWSTSSLEPKVTIVTHKVQTTRFPVRGVMMHEQFAGGARRYAGHLRAAPQAGSRDGEVGLGRRGRRRRHRPPRGRAPLDGAGRPSPRTKRSSLASRMLGARAILALNKIDLVDRAVLLAATKTLFDTGVYSDVLMISGPQRRWRGAACRSARQPACRRARTCFRKIRRPTCRAA